MDLFEQLNSQLTLSAQQISDFDHARRKRRQTLTISVRPYATIISFVQAVIASIKFSFDYIVSHKLFRLFVVPILAIWLALRWLPGSHTNTIVQLEFCLLYVIWWVGLGILSSIGLGSGLQSGLLFLFPHIIKICLTAQTCKSIDFDSASDMWFTSSKDAYSCPQDPSTLPATATVTLFQVWSKIIIPCFLQSAGTAIGEIPPYWLTRAARLAALESGTAQGTAQDALPEEFDSSESKFDLINRGKLLMVWFLKTYGFYGVLLMASYPNIAFDLCGIACGHFLMPFWTFFVATFLGKAVIRNSYQSIFYVTVCSEAYLEKIISGLQYILPDALGADTLVSDLLREGRNSFHAVKPAGSSNSSNSGSSNSDSGDDSTSGATALLSFWWSVFMGCLLVLFCLSCITHFAQYHQMTLDQAESNILRKKLPHEVTAAISSPMTGRLRLPPPTVTPVRRAQSKTPPTPQTGAKTADPLNKTLF